jgi:hypothetical protein
LLDAILFTQKYGSSSVTLSLESLKYVIQAAHTATQALAKNNFFLPGVFASGSTPTNIVVVAVQSEKNLVKGFALFVSVAVIMCAFVPVTFEVDFMFSSSKFRL